MYGGFYEGENSMFQIGERVVYGFHGVCCVVDLEERVIDRKKVVYMVLEPMGQGSSRFYIPTHNAAAMSKIRHMLTKEQLEELMQSETVRSGNWIPEENLRKQLYRELISKGDREQLLRMARSIYLHKAEQAAAGKRCHLCDENFLRDAERLLTSEIAMILELDPEQAKQYLRNRLTV